MGCVKQYKNMTKQEKSPTLNFGRWKWNLLSYSGLI